MSEPISRIRTADRDFDIWQRYAAGQTQQQIADHYHLDQSTVSDIIARMRNDTPIEERRARQTRALADLDQIRAETLALIEDDALIDDPNIRIRAMNMLLKIQERQAKALGTDAATKVSIEAEQVGERVKALLRRAAGEPDNDTA